jgi:hypothetical protein
LKGSRGAKKIEGVGEIRKFECSRIIRLRGLVSPPFIREPLPQEPPYEFEPLSRRRPRRHQSRRILVYALAPANQPTGSSDVHIDILRSRIVDGDYFFFLAVDFAFVLVAVFFAADLVFDLAAFFAMLPS